MIGADQHLAAAITADQFVGAMLADIVEGPDIAIPTADAKEALASDFEREVVAFRRQLRDMPGILPGACEQAVLLGPEDGRIGVVTRLQGPGRTGLDLGRRQLGRFAHSLLRSLT